MSDVSTIGSQIPEYESFIKSLTPAQISEGMNMISSFSSIQKSEQEQIEELIALLPKPQLDQINFIYISQHISDTFGINALASNGGPAALQNFGNVEGSIVLAGLIGWMRSEEQSAQDAREFVRSQENNPITAALKAYVTKGATAGNLNLQDVQFLRNAPILLASLKSQDVDLLMQAFQIAEQEIVLAMLNKWVEYEQQRAEIQKQDQKVHEQKQISSKQEMIENYLQKIQDGSISLSMTSISALIANLSVGAIQDIEIKKELMTPVYNVTANLIGVLAVPSDIQGSFTFALNAYATLAQYWSMPGAMSMMIAETNPSDDTITKTAVKSYAMTIAQLVLSIDFEKFVTQIARKNSTDISDEHLQSFIATLRICLLSSALAAI